MNAGTFWMSWITIDVGNVTVVPATMTFMTVQEDGTITLHYHHHPSHPTMEATWIGEIATEEERACIIAMGKRPVCVTIHIVMIVTVAILVTTGKTPMIIQGVTPMVISTVKPSHDACDPYVCAFFLASLLHRFKLILEA